MESNLLTPLGILGGLEAPEEKEGPLVRKVEVRLPDNLEGLRKMMERQTMALKDVYRQESFDIANAASSLKERVSSYFQGSEVLTRDSEAADYARLSMAGFLSELSGSPRNSSLEYRPSSVWQDLLDEAERDGRMAPELASALDIAVPAVCSSISFERILRPEQTPDDFVSSLYERRTAIGANALEYSEIITGARTLYSSLDFDRAMDTRRGRSLLEKAVDRARKGVMLPPDDAETYLISKSVGCSMSQFRESPVSMGSRFSQFDELEGPSALDEGLKASKKISLPKGSRIWNPVMVHRPGLKDDSGTKRSFFAMALGLDKVQTAIWQKVLLGEGALVGFDPDHAKFLFDSAIDSGVPLNRKLEGESESYFDYIESCFREPPKGGRAGEVGFDLLMSSLKDADSALWGPRGFSALMKSAGAGERSIGWRLQRHAEAYCANGVGSQKTVHEQLLSDKNRSRLLSSIGMNPIASYMGMDSIPVIRLPKPSRIQGMSAVEDSFHRCVRQIAETAESLKDSKGGSKGSVYQAELQCLVGYYTLGSGAYDDLKLPYKRLGELEDVRIPGILPSLEQKEGMYREYFRGGRLPYSARMVAGADASLSAGVVKVPPYQLAVVRSGIVLDHLRSEDRKGSYSIEDQGRARVLGCMFGAFSSDSSAQSDLLREMGKRIGEARQKLMVNQDQEQIEAFESALVEFRKELSESHWDAFDYVAYGSARSKVDYTSGPFMQVIGKLCLEHQLVDGYLKEVAEKSPVIFSRYPRLHHQSYIALKPLVGDPDVQSVMVHPIQAGTLNLDFDGDQTEVIGSRSFDPEMKVQLDNYDPSWTVFDAGAADSLAFGLDLNALEGIIKANNYFAQEAILEDKVPGILSDDAFAALNLTSKDIFEGLSKDVAFLSKKFDQYCDNIAGELGLDASEVAMVNLGDGEGRFTSVSRDFFWKTMSVAFGAEKAAEALDSRFVPMGCRARTKPGKLEASFFGAGCLDVGPQKSLAICAGLYTYCSDMAVRLGGSSSVKGMPVADQLDYVKSDPLVSRIRKAFSSRISSIEAAQSAGFYDVEEATKASLSVEHGRGGVLAKGFGEALESYRSSSPENRLEAYEKACKAVEGALNDPSVGLKKALRCAVELSVERYAFETGATHVLTEQLLTAKIKAKEEILSRSFMGMVNLVDGKAEPASFGNLVDSFTVDDHATLMGPAVDRSVKSKTQVPVGGEFLKDCEASMQQARVGWDREPSEDELQQVALSEFFGERRRDGDGDLLCERVKLRELKLVSENLDLDTVSELEAQLNEASFKFPFSPKEMRSSMELAMELDPEVKIAYPSVLKDKSPRSLNPRSIGAHPMAGLVNENGTLSRQKLSKMGHRRMPIGSIAAGALGEDGTQAALRIRHVSGSSQATYSSKADYWMMKNGPFPSRNPAFRKGADLIESVNPVSVKGMETMGAAFSCKVSRGFDGLEPGESITAFERMEIDGIELFPGEKARLSDDGMNLLIGTDRPSKIGYGIAEGVDFEALAKEGAVMKAVPSVSRCSVTAESARKLGLDLESMDMYQLNRLGGELEGLSAMVVGSSIEVVCPADRVVDLAARLDVDVMDLASASKPAVGSKMVEVEKGSALESCSVFVVKDSSIAPEIAGIPPGAIVSQGGRLAFHDNSKSLDRATDGMMEFLDCLKSRPLAPEKAVLSPVAGKVESVVFKGRFGAVDSYQARVEGRKDPIEIDLPKGSVPSVVPGQAIEAGDPMTFGFVDFEEKAPLRGEKFRDELAEYCYAYYYKGASSMWSVNTDLLARSLASDQGVFQGLGKAYASDRDPRLAHGKSAAARLGKVDLLIREAVMGSGIVPEDGFRQPVRPLDLDAERERDLEYPGADLDRRQAAGHRDMESFGKKAVRERAEALGLDLG